MDGCQDQDKRVYIATEGQPKVAIIGDYGLEQQATKIVNLLKEYQDVFSKYYKDIKGSIQEMCEMKIDLIPKAKPIKKTPYKISHKYKDIVKTEIDNMIATSIIYPVDQS